MSLYALGRALRRKLGVVRHHRITRRLRKRLYRTLFPRRDLDRRKTKWESKWSKPDFDAPWLRRGITKEIEAAVADGWFHPGGATFDVGCGEGDVAAWMASQGYPSLGADFAAAAIERARSRYEEEPGQLEYRVLDLCNEAPTDRRFLNLVDRGCFHVIPPQGRADFVNNVASVAEPGARLLLFIKGSWSGQKGFRSASERRHVVDMVVDAFSTSFEVDRIEDTFMDAWGGEHLDRARPGVAFWMTRR